MNNNSKHNSYRKQIDTSELMDKIESAAETTVAVTGETTSASVSPVSPLSTDTPAKKAATSAVKTSTKKAATPTATPPTRPSAKEVLVIPKSVGGIRNVNRLMRPVEHVNKLAETKAVTPVETATTVQATNAKKVIIDGKEMYTRTVAGQTVVSPTTEFNSTIHEVTDKVAKLDLLVNKYIEKVSVPNPSEQTKLQFVKSFAQIVEYVLDTDSYAVYNRFYDHFVQGIDTHFRAQLALAGIHKIRDNVRRPKIARFYTVYLAMANAKIRRKPFGLSIKAIRIELPNTKFTNWIQAKLSNRMR